MLLIACTTFAQSSIEHNKELYNKLKTIYSNNEDVTAIEIGPAMTKMLATTLRKSGNMQSADMMASITSLNILVESGKEFDFFTDMFDVADKFEGMELISTVDRIGEYSRFYFSEEESDESEFLMCVRRKQNRILLYITGDFTIADITELATLQDSFTPDN